MTSEVESAGALVLYNGTGDTIGLLEFSYAEGSQLGGTSPEIANVDASAALPEDAVRAGSYYLPPTPQGPIGLIVDRWESPSLGSIVVIFEQESAQQPGSPSQTVVPRVTIVLRNAD